MIMFENWRDERTECYGRVMPYFLAFANQLQIEKSIGPLFWQGVYIVLQLMFDSRPSAFAVSYIC